MTFKNIPLKQITWDKRIREDIGDIESLAYFIKFTKRVSPILVRKIKTNKYKGQAGKRRYLAVKMLGWKSIPADVER